MLLRVICNQCYEIKHCQYWLVAQNSKRWRKAQNSRRYWKHFWTLFTKTSLFFSEAPRYQTLSSKLFNLKQKEGYWGGQKKWAFLHTTNPTYFFKKRSVPLLVPHCGTLLCLKYICLTYMESKAVVYIRVLRGLPTQVLNRPRLACRKPKFIYMYV